MLTRILVIAAVLLSAASASAQKPVKELPIFVDSPTPPATVEAMTDAASAVVVATYTGTSRPTKALPQLYRDHLFTITEILKLEGHLPYAGSDIAIPLAGSRRETADHVEQEWPLEVRHLRKGNSYLLFLKWNIQLDRWDPAWGSRGIFDISDGAVTALHESQGHQYDGQRSDVFVAKVKAKK